LRQWLRAAAFAVSLSFATAADADSEGEVTATLQAFRVEKGPGGAERLIPALEAQAGDIVEYQAEYRNHGKTPVRNLEVAVPLPPGMDYVPGSAQPANVLASEDGLAFGPVPLMRPVKTANGGERLEHVSVADYRFLLWRIPRIGAESSVLLSLRTQVTRKRAASANSTK
jgi:uncharacterized repeat protein (TIGR01451 family)